MKRSTRLELAKQTVEITERGNYVSTAGREVSIAQPLHWCLGGTRFFVPEELARLRDKILSEPSPEHRTIIEVANETTLQGVARLLAVAPEPVAVLNFASAKNPGGGFLNGSQAQEESLARSSALYASLLRTPEFYERHRASPSLLYSDAMIFSPGCPVFRDDEGALLDQWQPASFITSAAPNAGAAANTRADELPQIPEVFRRRSECVLALAAAHGYQRLVLGAWGCGVFRNDPEVVASSFAAHLRASAWEGRFKHVLFSVLDSSPAQHTYAAFQRSLDLLTTST